MCELKLLIQPYMFICDGVNDDNEGGKEPIKYQSKYEKQALSNQHVDYMLIGADEHFLGFLS